MGIFSQKKNKITKARYKEIAGKTIDFLDRFVESNARTNIYVPQMAGGTATPAQKARGLKMQYLNTFGVLDGATRLDDELQLKGSFTNKVARLVQAIDQLHDAPLDDSGAVPYLQIQSLLPSVMAEIRNIEKKYIIS